MALRQASSRNFWQRASSELRTRISCAHRWTQTHEGGGQVTAAPISHSAIALLAFPSSSFLPSFPRSFFLSFFFVFYHSVSLSPFSSLSVISADERRTFCLSLRRLE